MGRAVAVAPLCIGTGTVSPSHRVNGTESGTDRNGKKKQRPRGVGVLPLMLGKINHHGIKKKHFMIMPPRHWTNEVGGQR